MRKTHLIFICMVVLFPTMGHAQWANTTRDERIRRTEELLDAEPTLPEVRRAALHHFRVSPGALPRVRELTRSKSSVPVVLLSTEYTGPQAQRDLRNRDRDIIWADANDHWRSDRSMSNLTIAWNFPDVVFTPTELQVYPLDEMQRIILRAINRMYYIRRQLLLSYLIDPPEDDRAIFALRMRIEGFSALLNAYTGGWFLRQLPEDSI